MSNIDKKQVLKREHKIIIDSRKKMTITNVIRAISANNTSVIFELQDTKLYISGQNLHISKLDLDGFLAEVEGEIGSVKYLGSPVGFFKRMLK